MIAVTTPIAWHIYSCEISLKNIYAISDCFLFQWNLRNEYDNTPLKNLPAHSEGKLVVLEKLNPRTFCEVIELFKNPSCSDFFFMQRNSTQVYEYDYIELLYEEYFMQLFGKMITYTVQDKSTKRIAGIIHIRDEIDETTNKRVFILGGLATPSVWGKGLSQETMKLLSTLFFQSTTSCELTAETSPYNGRCSGYLLKCGFTYSHTTHDNQLSFKLSKQNYEKILSLKK